MSNRNRKFVPTMTPLEARLPLDGTIGSTFLPPMSGTTGVPGSWVTPPAPPADAPTLPPPLPENYFDSNGPFDHPAPMVATRPMSPYQADPYFAPGDLTDDPALYVPLP
jgi:hypothetical protein